MLCIFLIIFPLFLKRIFLKNSHEIYLLTFCFRADLLDLSPHSWLGLMKIQQYRAKENMGWWKLWVFSVNLLLLIEKTLNDAKLCPSLSWNLISTQQPLYLIIQKESWASAQFFTNLNFQATGLQIYCLNHPLQPPKWS